MSGTRILPYRSLAVDSLRPAWWYERAGTRQPLPDLLPGWDYAQEELLGATLEVVRSEIEDGTGLTSLESVALVLIVDCPSLLRRFAAEQRLGNADEQQVELTIAVPPGEAANKLELTAHLVLVDDLAVAPGRAFRKASRLGSSQTRRLILEGEASRFPTEAISFSSIGLERAPWTVRVTMDGLNDSFMGAVRLLVNEDHELGQGLLEPAVDPNLANRLKFDVMRTLIAEAARWDAESFSGFEEDSVGAVLTSMCELFFARSLVEAAKLYSEEPAKFDRMLYSAVDA